MNKAHGNNRSIAGKRRITNRSGELLHGDLTEKILGLCYKVHHQYGSGQKESVYQNALAEKMSLADIPYRLEVSISITSVDTGKKLGTHRLDVVVDEKVILELKAVKFTPIKIAQQLYSCLRNSSYNLGLLINFGSSKLFIKRIILTKNS